MHEARRRTPTKAALVGAALALATCTLTTTAHAATTTACSGPIKITSGGTYGGCHQSTNASVPAVSIATTAPVVIKRMTIRHTGRGVTAEQSSTHLSVVDSTFMALNPGKPVDQQAFYAYKPLALVVEHNAFFYGHGVLVNGDKQQSTTFSISFNNFVDVGRFGQADCCLGAIHTDKVLAPGGRIDWNRATATYGRSLNEDVFGIYMTNGAANKPLDIGHNLVNGSYPMSGNGSGFTGGAFDLGDNGGSWLYGHDNTAVNYTNNGFMIPAGDHITQMNSIAVSDGHAGLTDNGPLVSSTFSSGITSWHNPDYEPTTNAVIKNITAGNQRMNGSLERSDFYTPSCSGCQISGEKSMPTVNAAAEKAAINAFEKSVTAANVVIGPRPTTP